MPRIKISKHGKRNRENLEVKIAVALTNLDLNVAEFLVETEKHYFDILSKISHSILSWKNATPQFILNMTMKELRESGASF